TEADDEAIDAWRSAAREEFRQMDQAFSPFYLNGRRKGWTPKRGSTENAGGAPRTRIDLRIRERARRRALSPRCASAAAVLGTWDLDVEHVEIVLAVQVVLSVDRLRGAVEDQETSGDERRAAGLLRLLLRAARVFVFFHRAARDPADRAAAELDPVLRDVVHRAGAAEAAVRDGHHCPAPVGGESVLLVAVHLRPA